MADSFSKSFRSPDENMSFPLVTVQAVEIGDLTVGRSTLRPGWRWSTHMKPVVGGEWCQARHVGVLLSGRMGVLMEDGTTFEVGPDEAYHIAPGHDGYIIGDEPATSIEWAGIRPWTGFMATPKTRLLRTLLFTDLVDSTVSLNEIGDAAWRVKLSAHFESARDQVNRFGGAEVKTTGDGMLATFDGPVHALSCAAAIIRGAERDGLQLRAGVHVGEVEQVGRDIRGAAVHEAARVMSAAGANEILVSEITKTLASASGAAFEDRGEFELKGFPAPVRLFAYRSSP